ncbi:MAG: 3'-5' exonuclease [Planctomycetota bacterium]
MFLPANELPRLTELVVARLTERGPAGATPGELAALALRAATVPDAVAGALLEPILAADRRMTVGDDGRWRLQAVAADPGSLRGATYVVTDVETTGTGTDCRIIEIGAVRIVNGARDATFQHLVDPEQRLQPEITQLTGITGAMLEGQPSIREVMPRYTEFLGDAVFVAHNAAFDRRFIYGQADADCGILLENPVLCTRNLARRTMPNLKQFGLDPLTRALGITIPDRHRGLGDALATAELLLHEIECLVALGWDRLEHALRGQTADGWRKMHRERAKAGS